MKRTFAAGLLALPALLAGAVSPAAAQSCASGNCGSGGSPAAHIPGPGFNTAGHMGCPGGFCFRLFGGARFGQEGPLFNYGPYAGYYPFAPYGPWGSDMSYNGPGGGGCNGPGCGWNRCLGGRCGGGRDGCGGPGGCGRTGFGLGGFGHGGRLSGLGGGCSGGACGGAATASSPAWGGYAMTTFRGVFSRSHPLCNKAKISTGCSAAPASGCGDCAGASAVAPAAVHTISAESGAEGAATVGGYRER